MESPNRAKTLLIFLLIFLVALIGSNYYFYRQVSTTKEKYEESKNMYEAANQKTEFYKDELGRSVAKSKVIQSLKTKDFTDAIFNSPEMKELQKLVKANASKLKNGGSATVISSEGSIVNSGDTEVSNLDPKDTLCNPTFKDSFNDEWITYSISANKDKVNLDFKYKDFYSIVVGTEKDSTKNFIGKLFSKRKAYAYVTSSSPYTTIKETKTYKVSTEIPSRLSLGVFAGYGYSVKDLDFGKPQPVIGVGISYRLFTLGKAKVKNE